MTSLPAQGTIRPHSLRNESRKPQALILALALAFALSACGGDEPPSGPGPPQTGLIQVSTATTGADLDPDGYSAGMDGTSGRSIGLNGAITFTDVAVGQHQVELTGLAANCSVTGDNPATVAVTADATAQAAFVVTCVATSGSIDITTVTTGSFLDPNGFTFTVDAVQSQGIGINAAVTLTSVAGGDHSIELSDVAGNCTVGGTNPTTATVVPGTTVQVSFDVNCSPPAPGTIAFLSERGGNLQSEVFVMDGAGSVVTQVTQMAARKWSVLISPDGTRILFRAGDLGQRDLWVVNIDGTGLFNLTNSLSDNQRLAEWSPDGSKVAYTTGGLYQLWVISASGGAPTLLSDYATISLFDWSPDGSKIAFTANPDSAEAIYLINSDGSGLQQLTNPGQYGTVRWSPDGSKIVFMHNPGTPLGNIYIMNADGTGVTQLTAGLDGDPWNPTWSPDGSRIAFSVAPRFAQDAGLWIMNSDGSGQRKLTGPWVGAVWSPDGSTLVFGKDTGPNTDIDVYTIRPDGSGLSNITNDPAWDFAPSWGP